MNATPIAIAVLIVALSVAGWDIYRAPAKLSDVTLYSGDGLPVQTWVAKGRVSLNRNGCSFTSSDGKEIAVTGTVVVGQR